MRTTTVGIMKITALAFVLIATSLSLDAETYKCAQNGQTIYQDTPCKDPNLSSESSSQVKEQLPKAGVFLDFSRAFQRDNSEKARRTATEEFLNAVNGSIQSQYNTGAFFLAGYGTEPDLREATDWFTKAADSGHVPSQLALGAIFSGSAGTEPDYKQALMWFEKAAELQDATAEAALGRMYALGLGVPTDYERAVDYLERAVQHGNQQAKELLDRVGPQLKIVAAHEKAELEAEQKRVARGWEAFEQAGKHGIMSTQYMRACAATFPDSQKKQDDCFRCRPWRVNTKAGGPREVALL